MNRTRAQTKGPVFVRLIRYAAALLLAVSLSSAVPTGVTAAPSCARAATSAAQMTTASSNITGLGASDGFRTGRLPDGRWMSTTGDTMRPGESLPAYDNSIVIWDNRGQRRVSTPGDPMGNFFPRWPDGSEFWPYQWTAVGTTVYVTGSRQLVRPGGDLDWTSFGAYGATLAVGTCGTPMFMGYWATPSTGQDDTFVQWSAALSRDPSYIYIHGGLDAGPDYYRARHGGYVARATPTTITIAGLWEFWNGTGWTPGDDSVAVSTIPASTFYCGGGVGGTEHNYTLHRRPNGTWAVTTKCGSTLSTHLGRYNGPSPRGPWTYEPLAEICDTSCYIAGAAWGVPTIGGRSLVQWSRTNALPEWLEVPA